MNILFSEILLLFALAVAVAFLATCLRLPTLVSFLLTGVIAGPYGLGVISAIHEVEQLAEIGVILLLFTVGLEFSLDRLNQIRTLALGAGGLQVGLTIAAATGLALLFGVTPERAVFLGFLLSLSSTAIVLKLLFDRGETDAPHGRFSVGVLLFQDLCVIPMVMLVPVLGSAGGASTLAILTSLGQSIVVIAIVLLTARRLIPPLLSYIVRVRSQDVFVLAVVLLAGGTAWLTAYFGLSLALGAFVAGLVISESPYSYQVLSDALPFRAAFNSLFFISIGMLLDTSFVLAHLPAVSVTVIGVLALKFLVLGGVVSLFGYPFRIAFQVGMVLSQIGEFSFVLMGLGQRYGLLPGDFYQLFLASAVLTMLLTPLLVMAAPGVSHWVERRFPLQGHVQRRSHKGLPGDATPLQPRVIVAGYGLNGRNLARALRQSGLPYVVLALDAEAVDRARREGEPIFYGDVTNPEVLKKSGIAHAQVFVFAISDPVATRRAVAHARRLNPTLHIIARTKYVGEIDALYNLGANEVIAEEFETSLEILGRVLFHLLVPATLIEQQIAEIRSERYEMFRHPHPPGSAQERLAALLSQTRAEVVTVAVGTEADGKTLAELSIRSRTGASVIAVLRGSESYPNPSPSFTVACGDWLVLLGREEEVKLAEDLLAGIEPPEVALSEQGARLD
jgi:CPA2 family monovalent cation:H+ antiporter-2